MRKIGILVFIVALLIAGGGIMAQLADLDIMLFTTGDPEASVFEATPQQAEWFILMTIFIISNVVVVGGLLAFVFWWLSKQVSAARSEETPQEAT